MAETVVVGSDGADEGSQSVAESAHQAAVAEGAVAVQAQQAAESAAEATAAAEVALAAAEARGATVARKGLLWIVTHGDRRLSLFPDGHLLVHDCTAPDEALTEARELFQP